MPEPVLPLDPRERRKRRREGIVILLLSLLFVFLTFAEFHLTKVSSTLPFVNSIFFFGLLNINIIILIALVWLVFRNIGKVFIERRRKVLGSRLKTKLVIAFLAFSIIPTLVLFVISAMYINSSFDKWFSLKVQNTLQASLEIVGTFYRNTDQTAMHFAEHLADSVGKRMFASQTMNFEWVRDYLSAQRELLALDAVEFYPDSFAERVLAHRENMPELPNSYPRLALDLLDRALAGERVSVMQHIGTGDLIRCLVPVYGSADLRNSVLGAIVVDSYIPVSLVNKVDEIASVFDDYKDTNPLKYPMKTAYLVILVMITLVIIFVAIWIGLYMARELTVPVERLVHAAKAIGSGDLDVSVSPIGHDEIAVLVESFNKMTLDLKNHREQLTQASADLERRRLQLEAVLTNIGAGVIAIDSAKRITTFNPAVARLIQISPESALGQYYTDVFRDDLKPLVDVVDRALNTPIQTGTAVGFPTQWNQRSDEELKSLAAVATPLLESQTSWGVVVVIDDMTYLVKGQREMAWREVARRIAHEIKNPLTPIKLSAQRLQRRMGGYRDRDASLLKECTDTIIKHTDELKEMVNEFSNFARFPEASPAPHNLNQALMEVISLYQQAHSRIDFRLNLGNEIPIFEFDRDQIKRVVINLLDNAVAAVVSTPSHQRSRQITLSSYFDDQLQIATIEVGDNGAGMTDEIKVRVFEPYFSTKTEGTGLGLAIAKRIINDHDGFIRVQSAPGEGTRFLVELPTSLRLNRPAWH